MIGGTAVTSTDVVDLWVIRADQPPPVVRRLRGLLDPGELLRADAASDELRRDRFTVVHGAVRLLAGDRLGIAADLLRWRHGPHGKPEPAGPGGGLQLSYSASGALAVLAFAEGRRIGADVEERADARTATRIAGRFFPGVDARFVASATTDDIRARRFTRLWCRREACVKVFGGRLAQGLGLPLAGPTPLVLADPGSLGSGPCRVVDVPLPLSLPGPPPGRFHAAVAVEGERPYLVRCRVWSPGADPTSDHRSPQPRTEQLP